MPSVLAAQLYTLRQFCQTAADLAKTLHKCREIGYEAVQVSGIGASIPYTEVAKILKNEGLTCCATHIFLDAAMKDPQKIIDDHVAVNCKYTAVGSAPDRYKNEQGWKLLAKDMSDLGRKLKDGGGITLGYHNHAMELTRYGNQTGMDILYGNSDPNLLTAEIDTYWIQYGGGDPAAWIRKLAGRLPLLHLKDMAFGVDVNASKLPRKEGESDDVYAFRKQQAGREQPLMAEIGEGNLNWSAILSAAKEAKVLWYIIEQDVCQRDPFESLAISLRNLKAMGLK